MRGLVQFVSWPALAGIASAIVLALALFPGWSLPATAQEGTPAPAAAGQPTIGIDADATGNTATSLGQRNTCIAVDSGDEFEVDVIAENISGLSAWEAYVSVNTSVVHIIDRDVQQLLVSVPGSNVFDISESVPEDGEDNGLYRVGGAIITDIPLGVDGSGVLARLTMKAQQSGLTTLSLREQQTDVGRPVGATLTDKDANQIGDTDDDGFFDGSILDAKIAVNQDCPTSEDGSAVSLLRGDDGGVPAWVIIAAAVGIVATAGFGGLALIRLRRAGPRGSL